MREKPDFYGPIWILITLVFALTIFSNFSRYLEYIFDAQKRNSEVERSLATFKFKYLVKAIVVCFGSWLLAPLSFFIGLFILGKKPNRTQIAELYCIWGYSYIFYILATIVSIIPVKTLIFFAFVAAAVFATLMLLTQFNSYLSQFAGSSKYVLLALVVGWQVLIFFAFRFSFF